MGEDGDFRNLKTDGGRYQSWGRLWPPAKRAVELSRAHQLLPTLSSGETLLPFGNGRSYGDCCLNDEGVLLDARPLNSILSFDPESGIIRCEGGVLLGDILERCIPDGWFLPVTPGTKFVTVGGAIANDVHGKNHHRAGTFGRHVTRLALERSDRPQTQCSMASNAELFRATVGGLGLTGLILWADIQLRPIVSSRMDSETIRFHCLDEFFSFSEESDETHEYTVAWVDCTARGSALGRGWFFRGNHAISGDIGCVPPRRKGVNFMVDPPISLVNSVTLGMFNALYYHRPAPKPGPVSFEPFFYPLDAVLNWNRIYGPRGFFQFQCALPREAGREGLTDLLKQIRRHRQGSFLAVLKVFGDLPSPGILSFPRPGPTLAVDFPNRGAPTRRLLAQMEEITLEAGGVLYPGKDAVMSPAAFQVSYPNWALLGALKDPNISSNLWRRVTAT